MSSNTDGICYLLNFMLSKTFFFVFKFKWKVFLLKSPNKKEKKGNTLKCFKVPQM